MKLEFSNEDIALVGKALGFLPYVEVANLIDKLKKQIGENDDTARAESTKME